MFWHQVCQGEDSVSTKGNLHAIAPTGIAGIAGIAGVNGVTIAAPPLVPVALATWSKPISGGSSSVDAP